MGHSAPRPWHRERPGAGPFEYGGRELDPTGLYYMRVRYYSPGLQRFISPDPSGLGGGDVNVYGYAGNSPTNFSDPTGLDSEFDDGLTFSDDFDENDGFDYPPPFWAPQPQGNEAEHVSLRIQGPQEEMAEVLGLIWNSPNTAIGLIYALPQVPFGAQLKLVTMPSRSKTVLPKLALGAI
jgi:RHS repeat-associated protein